MSGRTDRSAIADWATIIMAVCAVFITALAVWTQVFRDSRPTNEDRQVRNWEEYLDGGHRIGPEDAPVTIVEFGDYECPFCNRLQPAIRSVLAEFPEEVTHVYRHMPLAYHEHAYQAARLAECAAVQGRFAEAHILLYDTEDLGAIDSEAFGTSVGVTELATFVECAASAGPVDRIERDREAAERLEITSTPTVIVNGLRLGRTPDKARLFELVQQEISRESRK